MNIQTIHEHSVDLDLLSGGICIDAGCRGFQFSEAMRDLGLYVIAFDLEDWPELRRVGIEYMRCAISNKTRKGFYKNTTDLQAKHICETGEPINIMSLNDVYGIIEKLKHNRTIADIAIDNYEVDVLKLDIEGSEYLVLSDPNFQPIPKQISVEFHLHCHRALHDQYYNKCMENLLKWYEPVKHELTQAHGAGFNYWDSLFIRKDLITNHE